MKSRTTYKEEFIDGILDMCLKAVPGMVWKQLSLLTQADSTKADRSVSRQILLHDIGNMVVLAYAVLERRVAPDRQAEYQKLFQDFEECTPKLKKASVDIPPQIRAAYLEMEYPHLAD
jgi:hypothetical protein